MRAALRAGAMALDFLLFGSGHGLAAPFFSQPFYWLIDTHRDCGASRNGAFYTYNGGFGSQLTSFQWRHPRAQERRRLAGMDFQPFNSTRRWLRVRVSWARVEPIRDPAEFRVIEDRLRSPISDF